MRQLSEAGERAIGDLAQRYGFSSGAVVSMLESVVNGNGTMAQFSHPEFSGSGQWMRGGMIMVSDMFNNLLKGRIDGLCNELSALVANEDDLITSGSFQSQSQGGQRQGAFGGGHQQQSGSGPAGRVSLFVPPPAGSPGHWWPADLGQPTSSGAQNNVRYAYFAQTRSLAIEANGRVTVYDTLDHQIAGFSQQQSTGASLTFSSQHGLVDVATFRRKIHDFRDDATWPPARQTRRDSPAGSRSRRCGGRSMGRPVGSNKLTILPSARVSPR